MNISCGTILGVTAELETYLSTHQGKILFQSAVKETVYYTHYGMLNTQLYAHLFFTGDMLHLMVGVYDIEHDRAGSYICTDPESFSSLMVGAAEIISSTIYPYGQKAMRAVLLDIGRFIQKVYCEFITTEQHNLDSGTFNCKYRVNEFRILDDIDWLEDLIKGVNN